MAIPDYQTLMLPLLDLLDDAKEHSFAEAVDALADQFELSAEERQKLLPSGQYPLFRNRVGWARTYLVKAALVERIRRGSFRITERGLSVLASKPSRVDVSFLQQFPEFRAFREPRHAGAEPSTEIPEEPQSETPEEALDLAYERLRKELESELLDQVKTASPGFSADAVEYVSRIDSKIILVDGSALAKLMIDHGVGVSTTRSYELKRIDLDYFAEE